MARLLVHPSLRMAGLRTVIAFWSFGSEISTHGLIGNLQQRGIRVLLPYRYGVATHVAELAPGDEPVPSAYGPREPPRRTPVAAGEADVVIAPGLAFDERGNRLGYGGGAFDRLLRDATDAIRIGLCFDVQVVDEVPHGPLDEPVHLVITDRRVIEAAVP